MSNEAVVGLERLNRLSSNYPKAAFLLGDEMFINLKLHAMLIKRNKSLKQRQAVSKAHKGKIITEETKMKIRIAHLGKKLSEEHKQKIRLALQGSNGPGWKGGIWNSLQGYRYIYKPNHPFCTIRGYVREHRLVMEKHLRRYLNVEERMHHLNGIKNDNRIENLRLFNNESEHQKFQHGEQIQRVKKAIIEYRKIKPNATWKELYNNIPNNYSNHRCMERVVHLPKRSRYEKACGAYKGIDE